MSLKAGDYVQRHLEGEWFDATIEKVRGSGSKLTVCLRYLDDDNYESDVPIDEVQLVTHNSENRRRINRSSSSVDMLLRPLAGLVDDDYETRKNHMPTVFVHEGDTSLEEAIIMNGAENRLAAGGGLRALRYLKS
jgi:hypothetical protein